MLWVTQFLMPPETALSSDIQFWNTITLCSSPKRDWVQSLNHCSLPIQATIMLMLMTFVIPNSWSDQIFWLLQFWIRTRPPEEFTYQKEDGIISTLDNNSCQELHKFPMFLWLTRFHCLSKKELVFWHKTLNSFVKLKIWAISSNWLQVWNTTTANQLTKLSITIHQQQFCQSKTIMMIQLWQDASVKDVNTHWTSFWPLLQTQEPLRSIHSIQVRLDWTNSSWLIKLPCTMKTSKSQTHWQIQLKFLALERSLSQSMINSKLFSNDLITLYRYFAFYAS